MMIPSDIAGLSERLREQARLKCWREETPDKYLEWKAATALESLSARVKELEARQADDLAEFGLMEMRALSAEQQRDEAYERAVEAILALRIRAACNFIDDNCKGQRGQDRTDALADAANEVRRLASGPEGGSEGEK